MVIEGDLTQSRVQIPKEDRPVSSLQLNHSLVVLQIMIPSSGQFLLELNVSNSPVTRMRLSAATFISRADVVDAKGMAHAKIPLVIPRNCWVQIVFHVGGIFTHLFRLPAVKWIDSVVLAGSCKVRKVMTCADEATAIESKPGGMLLFAVPAYGPPVWQTAGGAPPVPQPQILRSDMDESEAVDMPSGAHGDVDNTPAVPSSPTAESASSARSPALRATGRGAPVRKSPPPRPQPEVSTRTLLTVTSLNKQQQQMVQPRGPASDAARTDSPGAGNQDVTPPSSTSGTPSAPPSNGDASPLRMRFCKGEDGRISFTASNPEQEASDLEERKRQLDIIERLRQEAEALRVREESDRQRRERAEEGQQEQYVRIVDMPDQATPLVSGRRTTLTTSNVDTAGNRRAPANVPGALYRTPLSGAINGSTPPAMQPAGLGGDGDDGLGCWDDEGDQTIFSSMLAGGMGNNVVQVLNAAGKPIVVPKKPEDAAALTQASVLKSTRAAMATTAPKKPRVSTIRNPNGGSPVVPRRKKASLPPSMMLLSLRPQQSGDAHPADDYDPEVYRRVEPDVGYGCGFMDVLHGNDEEEEEEYEEE